MKLLNFENWSSGESQNVNDKKCAPKIVFFNEKKSQRFG